MDSLRLFHGCGGYGESTRRMDVITQFHSCALKPEELNQVLADYVALERVRVFRRLLVRRFGALSLAALVIGVALHRISPVATGASVALFLIPPIWACVIELRFNWALDRRLERIPGVIHSSDSGSDISPHASGPRPNGKS
jgi:hypothetical protein